MNHIHKCDIHQNCVVIVEVGKQRRTHIENVTNIDNSCPYYGLHLHSFISDECSQKKQGL